MELVGEIKTYDWGKLGTASMAAQLATLNTQNFSADATTPYAELWMGTDPSGHCTVKASGKELWRTLAKDLPFVFKVLSVRRALSIQVHPSKAEAERLHRQQPDVYKDANHKPKLAIALTPFKALVGFRPHTEIYEIIELLPPLKILLGDEKIVMRLKTGRSSNMCRCYERLMTSKQKDIDECIREIIKKHSKVLSKYGLLNTFSSIMQDFPHDVGVLSIFFLNLIRLNPGQAIFLGDNEIHAYLSGDCIECMACSGNIIYAGLTLKYKDVEQLVSILNYHGVPSKRKLFRSHSIDNYAKLFGPPIEDFAVIELNLPADLESYILAVKPVGSILLVIQGERLMCIRKHKEYEKDEKLELKRGSIVYIPPDAAPAIDFVKNNKDTEKFIAYLAMANTSTL